METPNLNPIVQPIKRKKLSRKFWMIAILSAIILITGSWWLIKSQQTEAACVVGKTGQVYGQPPAVKHMYAEEKLAYRLNPNGQFVPTDDIKISETKDHEYSLRVSFDQPYINPRFGSRMTGTLELLEDGHPITEPPKDEQGKLIFQDLSVPVYLYGALGGVSKNEYKFNWRPAVLSPAGVGWASVPVLDHRIPYPITNIYVSGGVGKRLPLANGWTIDLSSGRAKFELNYFGLRYSPYLQLMFGALRSYTSDGSGITIGLGPQNINVTKTVCFADQVNLDIPQVIDELSQQTKADFYYDISTAPVKLANNKTTRVKIEVTARDAQTNKVETNPLQRVEISAVALGQVTDEPPNILNGKSDSTRLQVKFQSRGKFVLADPSQPKIEQRMLLQTAQNNDGDASSNADFTSTIFTDLVKGKATIYYDFTGADDSLNTPLTLVVQPADFELNTSNLNTDFGNQSSVLSNRSKQKITIPSKPAPFVGETGSSKIDFLYQTWQTNEIKELVYTVFPIPVGGASTGWWGKAITRLAVWQILIILFGSLMLAWQLHQQKNKNKINDGQIK